MPLEAIFVTNGVFTIEQSLHSRFKTLEGITNFVANVRNSGLGISASGPLEMQVRAGVNNVAVARTKDAFFDVMYSDSLTPSVLEMHGLGRDKNGLPFDIHEFIDDPTNPHVEAIKAWADTNNYPLTWQPEQTDSAVSNLLELQIPGFEKRYSLESRTQIEVAGYKTPFVTYTYAAQNCFKDFSNMNRDAINITLRVGGPDLNPDSLRPTSGADLVNFTDPGVVWRMKEAKSFAERKRP
jgi:hypothetical protein